MTKETPQITKESFVKIIEAIISLSSEADAFTKALQPFMDGHGICTFGQAQALIIMREVERSVRGKILQLPDGREWLDIGWWLYETNAGKRNAVVGFSGKEITLDTPEKLYDYMTGVYD